MSSRRSFSTRDPAIILPVRRVGPMAVLTRYPRVAASTVGRPCGISGVGPRVLIRDRTRRPLAPERVIGVGWATSGPTYVPGASCSLMTQTEDDP